eukprot:g2097.t1
MEVIVDKHGVKPFVFALVPAKKAKKIQKSTDDLRNFGKKAAFAGLPESHIVLTDCPEILPQILTKDALSVINRAAEDGVLHSVHFTDQNTAAGEDDGMKSTASLSFKFRLPKGAQSVDKLEEIVALAIKYIDVCHDVSIPASVRERNLKKRKEVALSIVKENSRERAAKKREEDMRRKDEKFKQLTPAQQAKAMEREERRRRKKMMKSGKIKILR